MLLPLLVTALAVHPVAHGNPADGKTADTPLVLRSYDISAALPANDPESTGDVLFPLLFSRQVDGGDAPDPSAADTLMQFVQSLYPEEFESNGRVLQIDEHRHLIVRAPEAVQQGVLSFLRFVENAHATDTELVVDVVDLTAPGTFAGSSVSTGAEADKLLAELAALPGSRRSSCRLRARGGSTAVLDMTTEQTLVTDYTSTIAQAATVLDPEVDLVRTGMRITTRSAQGPGGTWLALILRGSQPTGDVRIVELGFKNTITVTDQLRQADTPRHLQSLCTENRSFALNTFVPDEKVLVIQTALDLQGRKSGAVLCVRKVGKAAPRELHFAGEGLGARGKIDAFDWHFTLPPTCALVPVGNDPFFSRWAEMTAWRREIIQGMQAVFDRPNPDALLGLLTPDDDHRILTASSRWIWMRNDPLVEPGTGTPTEDPALVLSRLAPSPRVFQVSLSLVRGGAQERTVARVVLPVRLGESGAVVLGTEENRVLDNDVEVAQSASAADPIVFDVFDGLVAIVRPEASLGGDLALHVQASARIQRGETREFDSGATTSGRLAQATSDQLVLTERLPFPKDAGGTKRLQVTGPSGGTGPGALSLVIEMTEVR